MSPVTTSALDHVAALLTSLHFFLHRLIGGIRWENRGPYVCKKRHPRNKLWIHQKPRALFDPQTLTWQWKNMGNNYT